MRRRPNYRRWLKWALVALVLVAVVAVGIYNLNLRPVASHGTTRSFTINSGERTPEVASSLQSAGLIRDRNAFITYVLLHNLRADIKAGSYDLSPAQSTPTIVAILTRGEASGNLLVVPEGYTVAQIEAAAAKRGISKADFEAALAAPHPQSFLASKPAGVGLEGYLFPDSYQVGPQTSATDLVNSMLTAFGQRVGTSYDQDFSAEGLTFHQGLTLASIVEKEVSNPQDQAMVAQVFLTRLRTGMPLGSDVTVAYASAQLGVSFNLNVNSPYNTYRNVGLPPGPICNPGLAALDAVAHPATTNYVYFVTGKDGKTRFEMTLAQQQSDIAKYGQR